MEADVGAHMMGDGGASSCSNDVASTGTIGAVKQVTGVMIAAAIAISYHV
jgi:hypothetical protein